MQQYDAIVIGGGLVGCATACYLAESGATVLLVERSDINAGASGRNAGSLHFQLEHRLIKHHQEHARELEHYVALTQLAIDHWRDIEHELDSNLELVMEGGLMLAETPEELSLLELKSKIEGGQGLTVELLDGAQAHSRAPYLSESVQGALYCPHEGHCNPRLLTHAFASKAVASGASVLTDIRVSAIQRRFGRWEIKLAGAGNKQESGWVSAEAVLNAAGAWSVEIAAMAGLHLPVFPVGLLMNATEKTNPIVHHLIQHVGRKLSLKQVADGNLLIGGGWSAPMQRSGGSWLLDRAPAINLESVRGNLQSAAEIVPAIADLHLLRSWTGTTGITPDQLPVLGQFTQKPGFYVATGGSGFTYGPTYARLMSELMLTGATSFPIDAYSPDRFNQINAFMA